MLQRQQSRESNDIVWAVTNQAQRHRKHRVQQHVLEHRCRQHDPGEGRAKNPEVEHDAGNHRDAGHGHRDGEDEEKGGGIVGGSDEHLEVEPAEEPQSPYERYQRSDDGDEHSGSAFSGLERGAHLGSGSEHEKQQSHLVHGAEHKSRRGATRKDPGLPGGRHGPKESRTEHHSTENLAYNPRLAEPGKQVAETVRRSQQNGQRQKNVRSI